MNTESTQTPPGVAPRRLVVQGVSLGFGRGGSKIEEVLALGLNLGDVIRGKEYHGADGWSEAELTLLWMGREVVVWGYRWRHSEHPEKWWDGGERANWSLSCREWFLHNTKS